MTKKKIAWIDDEINKFLLRPYVDELEENNYEVVKINSTENLIQHLKEESASLAAILIDIIMPPVGLDFAETRGGLRTGLVILKKIRAESSLSGIPLIIVTNLDDEVTKKYCEVNKIPYITKSNYFSDEFVRKISDIINNEG